MARSLQPIYWDSCVFLYYINEDPHRLPTIEALLQEAQRQRSIKIVTSVISITEVAFAISEQFGKPLAPEQEDRIDQLWADRSVVEVVEFHELLARDARSLIRQAAGLGIALRPYDAVHLATAVRLGLPELQTYDKLLRRLDQKLGIRVVEPYTRQPTLI